MIPQWTVDGVLPPINQIDPLSPNRSPYETDLVSLVDRFATSRERCAILHGYLEHRKALHKIGLIDGFQWLDGSFIEYIEVIESRPPGDIDVVTFLRITDEFFDKLTPGEQQVLTDHAWIKQQFKVDFYPQSLHEDPEVLVSMSSYWYSMWSHRRTMQWKGFLKIDLAPHDDCEASDLLAARVLEFADEQK